MNTLVGLVSLRNNRGPVEALLRAFLNWVGLDPYDVNVKALKAFSVAHAAARKSRFWFRSPCFFARRIDFFIHQWLPCALREKYPELAHRLTVTSPRWSHVPLAALPYV